MKTKSERIDELERVVDALIKQHAAKAAAETQAARESLRIAYMALAAVNGLLTDHPRKDEIHQAMREAATAPESGEALSRIMQKLHLPPH